MTDPLTLLENERLGKAPRGAALASPGTPVVDGAVSVGALVLPIRGGPTGTAGWLLAGDFLQLGSGSTARLHMVTADAATDGSGETAVDIWPALRTGYSDGAAVTLTAPKGKFQLSGNARAIDQTRGVVVSLTLDAVEDLR